MVETITPVVYGRTRRYVLAVALHTFGAGLSAAILGAALGGLGALLGAPWGNAGLAVVVGVALVYLVREVTRWPIPTFDRGVQVPEWWRSFFSPPISALLYGLGLGIAFATFLSFGTFVVVAVAALVSGDPLIGAAICAPFGLARGLSVAVSARARDEEEVDRLAARLSEVGSTAAPRAVNAVMEATIAGVALLSLFV